MAAPAFLARRNFRKCLSQFSQSLRSSRRALVSRVSSIDEFYGSEIEEFKDENVQALLRKLTGFDLDKIFAKRKEELKNPQYKLMDDLQLKEAEEEMKKSAEKRLNPPTLMTERKPIEKVLSEDKAIAGQDDSKYVFTDISTTSNSRDRRVVVRESDGTLREANWDERDRMDFIYFPSDCQYYELPPLLLDEHLKNSFSQKHYTLLLDLVVRQCQPDDPNYARVCRQTYEEVNRQNDFEHLKSTCYYPGFLFYLITQNRIENFLRYLIDCGSFSDLDDFIQLYITLHPMSDVSKHLQGDNMDLQAKAEVFAQHVCPEMLSYVRSMLSKQMAESGNASA